MYRSVSETYGQREGSAHNGHFECTRYHRLFLFNQGGDLERALFCRGNHASAKFWRRVLVPVIERYRNQDIPKFFRGDAAFALDDLAAVIWTAFRVKDLLLLSRPVKIRWIVARPRGRTGGCRIQIGILRYNASMSEGPTLPRRWFRFSLLVTAGAIVTLSIFSAHASADDGTAALPDRVTSPITKVLPDTWTYESQRSRLVLRPRKQPVFANLTNGEGPGPNETWDDYKRRHTVKFDYQIVLRFEPKLSFPEFWRLVLENRGIHHRLQALEKKALAFQNKGYTSFPKTPEGEVLSQQRDQLLRSFRSVPAGHLGNMSVYMESTYLGYARFVHEEEKLEAEAVKKRIRDQLSPHTSEPSDEPPTQ